MRWLLFLSIFLSGSSLVEAQLPPGVLDRFSLQTVGRAVRVDLTLSAGFTCNGLVITRSVDSSQFEGIGLIGGICGDSAMAVNYSFTDSQPPLNQKLYYQVLLGGRIPSEVKSIVVQDFSEVSIRVIPNPAREHVRFEFEALDGQEHELVVFDKWGKPVVTLRAESGRAEMQLLTLATGLYLVQRSDRPWEYARLVISR
ncbi:MAG: T9SS type A sorting domain-containing protein [Bacteroidia bacterium]